MERKQKTSVSQEVFRVLCDRKSLENAVQSVSRVCTGSRMGMEVLSGIKFGEADGKLSLFGTDLMAEAEFRIDCDGSIDESFILDSDVVSKAISRLPLEDEVAITSTEKEKVRIASGESYFSLPLMDKKEYPDRQEFNPNFTFTVDREALCSASQSISYAALHSKETTRNNMAGVLFGFRGDYLELVGTDGYRMGINRVHLPESIESEDLILEIYKWEDCVRILSGMESDFVNFAYDPGRGVLRASCEDFVWLQKTVDEEFPDYEGVLPSEFECELVTDVDQMLAAIRRMQVVSSRESDAFTISLSDDQLVITSSSGKGQADASVSAVDVVGDEGVEVKLKCAYIVDVLKNASESLVKFLLNEDNPCVFKYVDVDGEVVKEFKYLVMPVRK